MGPADPGQPVGFAPSVTKGGAVEATPSADGDTGSSTAEGRPSQGLGGPESTGKDADSEEDDEEDAGSGQAGFSDGRVRCRSLLALAVGVAAAGLFL